MPLSPNQVAKMAATIVATLPEVEREVVHYKKFRFYSHKQWSKIKTRRKIAKASKRRNRK